MSPQGQSRSPPQLVGIWLEPEVLPVVPALAAPVEEPIPPPVVPPELLPPELLPPELLPPEDEPPATPPAVPVLDPLAVDDVPEVEEAVVPVVPVVVWSQTELWDHAGVQKLLLAAQVCPSYRHPFPSGPSVPVQCPWLWSA